jgi:hypothetical protein
MSWGIQCLSQTASTIDAAGRAAYADYRATLKADPGEVSAMDEQVEAALTAAQALLDSGAVGTGACLVSLSGHANPDHAKRKGWSNDRIVITVEQH